jgi:putative membrane protein
MGVMGLNEELALANASLSALSVVGMMGGWLAIRARRVGLHRSLMLGAASSSFLFLVLFAWRLARFGLREFRGGAAWTNLYRLLFLTHEPVAVINVPLVVSALALGLGKRYVLHREVARVAIWVWLFTATTGILVYLMLYRLPA